MSPVTRVVQLLQGLAKKVEIDGKREEDLYENFVCWAKSVISQKQGYIADSKSKIESLELYIADLKAGRIDLTSERATLEKDISE